MIITVVTCHPHPSPGNRQRHFSTFSVLCRGALIFSCNSPSPALSRRLAEVLLSVSHIFCVNGSRAT